MNKQQLASNPEYSVWVSASAGTGKTSILTARVIRLLLSGTDPTKILCLTYTKAAAAEMEFRIKQKLSSFVTLNSHEINLELEKLTGTIPTNEQITKARSLFLNILDSDTGIKIQTIHSFCGSLMRRFPIEANIAPHFKIMDDKIARDLLKKSQNQLLNLPIIKTEYQNSPLNIFQYLGENSFSDLMQNISNNCDKLDKAINKFGGTTGLKSAIYNLLKLDPSTNLKNLMDHFTNDDNFEKDRLSKIANSLILEKGSSFREIGTNILAWLNSDKEGRNSSFNQYKNIFLTAENEPRKKLAPVSFQKEFVEILQQEQTRVLNCYNKLQKLKIAALSAMVVDIASKFIELYQEHKNYKAYLDYNDLILSTSKLLKQDDIAPWVLYKLDGGIDHILLDEAQDTSLDQWQIIDAITTEFFTGDINNNKHRSIFVVGDEKQSIFSFQGAAPEIFNKMQAKFKARVTSSGKKWQNIYLEESYRSSPAILSLTDQVLSIVDIGNFNAAQHDTPKHAQTKHIPYHINMYGKVQIWPLITLPETPENSETDCWILPDKYKEKNDVNKLLAESIASNIESWLHEGRILQAKGRKVKASDIMILLRKRHNFSDNIISSLKQRNIKVAGHDRLVLSDHIAIMDLIALGKFLLLTKDDLSLASVLKSPLFGFSEEDLFKIAYNRGNNSIFKMLQLQQDEPFNSCYLELKNLLNKVDLLSPFNLYCYILENLNGRKKFATNLGEEASEILDEFLHLALEYEQTNISSLQGFINWFMSGQTQIKRDMEQSTEDVVRVMTIHAAKGLEAEIVILADTLSALNNTKQDILWHNSGVMLWPGSSSNDDEICQEIKLLNRKKQQEENYRLLYVALTRARSELYIAGAAKTDNIKDDSWYQIINKSAVSLPHRMEEHHPIIELGKPANILEFLPSSKDETIILPEHFKHVVNYNKHSSNKLPLNPSVNFELTDTGNDSNIELSQSAIKGKIIHKLLEYLPNIKANEQYQFAYNFLHNEFAKYIAMQQKKNSNLISSEEFAIIAEKLVIMINSQQMQEFFSSNSRAEISIIGTVDNKPVSARIDRMCVTSDKVMIMDYKTGNNSNLDQTGKFYKHRHDRIKQQMLLYKQLVENLYQNKIVECYVMWIDDCTLQQIDFT